MDQDIRELDGKGLREFAFVTAGLFAGLFGVFLPWLFKAAYPAWPWLLGAGLAAWGGLAPRTLRPLYRTWMKFGLLLNRITTPLVLGLVFYLVVFPIGLIMRLTGRDPMTRRFDDSADSYRVMSRKPQRENAERPF
jgi:hypothetical protein